MKVYNSIDYIYEGLHYGKTIVGAYQHVFGTKKSAHDLLEILCEANGRSVNGSMELFAKVNDAHQKLAVLVCPENKEIYFPTHAEENTDCVWINYGQVKQCVFLNHHCCKILFHSENEIIVNCSRKVIRRQMKRCEALLNTLGNPYEKMIDCLVFE